MVASRGEDRPTNPDLPSTSGYTLHTDATHALILAGSDPGVESHSVHWEEQPL